MKRSLVAYIVLSLLSGYVGISNSVAQTCSHFLNASDGDDANPGTIVAPVRSIEFAYATFPSGSEVCVAAGEYFYGSDSDGIQLASASKDMSFVLNEFGGATEIRFSEQEFSIDAGTGVISFLSGSSSQLSLGAGIINVDDPAEPSLINFLYSVRLLSGTLDISSINLQLEGSVGNPNFEHPSNPLKTPPTSAAIVFGGGLVIGAIDYSISPRSFLFNGSGEVTRLGTLPDDLSGSSIRFENTDTLVFPGPINASGAAVTFAQGGWVRFDGTYVYDAASSTLEVTSSHSGVAEFRDVFEWRGTSQGGIISISGTGEVVIEHLKAVGSDPGDDTLSEILLNGAGRLRISQMSSVPGSSGSIHQIDINNAQGSLELGEPLSSLELVGIVSNTATLELTGNVSFGDRGGLANEGTVQLGIYSLSLDAPDNLLVNAGIIKRSSITSFIRVSNNASFNGIGVFSPVVIENGIVLLSGSGSFESLSLEGGSLTISSGSEIMVSGDIELSNTSKLVVEAGASAALHTLRVTDSQSTISMPEGSSMTLGGDFSSPVSPESTIFAENDGVLFFLGPNHGVSGSSTMVLPIISATSSTVVVTGVSLIKGLTTTDGAITVSTMSGLEIGQIVAENGTVSVASQGTVNITDLITTSGSGALVTFDTSEPVGLAAQVTSEGGQIDFGTTGISILGNTILTGAPDTEFVLPALIVDSENAFLTIDSRVVVESSFTLDAGGVLLNESGILSLSSNLDRNIGVFAQESVGSLSMDGTDSQIISGFQGSVLPSLIIRAPDVVINSSATIFGSLSILSGGMAVADGNTLTLENDLRIQDGELVLPGSSSLWVGNQFIMDGGRFTLDSGLLTLNGNVLLSGGSLEAGASTWISANQEEAIWVLESDVSLNSLELAETAEIRLAGTKDLSLMGHLKLSTGSVLHLSNRSISMLGSPAPATVIIDGAFTSTSGSINLIGNGVGSLTIGGTGIFGNTTINLPDDQDSVSLVSGTEALYLSGRLRLESGSLDLNGAELSFSESTGVPVISYNLGDTVGGNGIQDGGRSGIRRA